ncbi:MAG: helix-turn-helix domain-containing protein [Flavobacteriaceae bacterium]
MLNHQEIIDRIEALRKKEGLTAAAFAQRIGVPRSSLSHLVSGRNKPSLDLLIKIADVFQGVSLDGLVFGKPAPTSSLQSPPLSKTLNTPTTQAISTTHEMTAELPFETEQNKETAAAHPHNVTSQPIKKPVQQIALFFEDGSFEMYSPKS